jgi:hypothetical protein
VGLLPRARGKKEIRSKPLKFHDSGFVKQVITGQQGGGDGLTRMSDISGVPAGSASDAYEFMVCSRQGQARDRANFAVSRKLEGSACPKWRGRIIRRDRRKQREVARPTRPCVAKIKNSAAGKVSENIKDN